MDAPRDPVPVPVEALGTVPAAFGGHTPPCHQGPLLCWQCQGSGSHRGRDVYTGTAMLLQLPGGSVVEASTL